MSELIQLLSEFDYLQILGMIFIILIISNLFQIIGFELFSSLILSLLCCLLCMLGLCCYVLIECLKAIK